MSNIVITLPQEDADWLLAAKGFYSSFSVDMDPTAREHTGFANVYRYYYGEDFDSNNYQHVAAIIYELTSLMWEYGILDVEWKMHKLVTGLAAASTTFEILSTLSTPIIEWEVRGRSDGKEYNLVPNKKLPNHRARRS